MKKVVLFLFAVISLQTAYAQKPVLKNMEDSLRVGWWTRNTQIGVNFSQASFNDNWKGGGVNNVALGFLANHKADFTKGKGIWTNDFQFQYGFLKNKSQDVRKSVDRIFIDSKYARKINPTLNYFVDVNFLSQFANGYAYNAQGVKGNKISNLFAPAYLSEAIGIEWKPVKYFALQLGGATLRQTFVNDNVVFTNTANKDGKSYGVEKGKTLLNEMGFQLVGTFDKDIAKNINLKWRYQGFLAYAPVSKPMDHIINAIITAKVNKYLNVNLTGTFIYDTDIINKWQVSQGLAAGFSVKL